MQAFNSFIQAAGGIMAGVKIGLLGLLFLSPVIIAVVLLIFFKKYKHTIILRRKTKGGTDKVLSTKFRIVKNKGEPEMIKTFKERLDLPIPPDEARDVQDNGAWFIEAYVTDGGEVTYINADAKLTQQKVKETHKVPLKGKITEIEHEGLKEKYSDTQLTRLSTQDKAFYFNRVKKANEKYQVSGFWDFVNRNAGIIGLVIFMVAVFIFFGDILAPAIEMKNADLRRAQLEHEIVQKLDQIINDRQMIPDEPVFNTSAPVAAAVVAPG